MEKIKIILQNDDITLRPNLIFCEQSCIRYLDIQFLISQRIKKLRIQHEFTQTELAETLHLTQKAYWRMEQPEYSPRIDKIIALAYLYNVSTDYLLGLTDTPTKIEADKIYEIGSISIERENNK